MEGQPASLLDLPLDLRRLIYDQVCLSEVRCQPSGNGKMHCGVLKY